MVAFSYVRSEKDPRHGVSYIIIKGLEERVRAAQLLGLGLSAVFFLLMLAVIFAAIRYPAFFGIVAACR